MSPTTIARLASCRPAARISAADALPSSVRIASGPVNGTAPISGRAVNVWAKSRNCIVPSVMGSVTNSDAIGIAIAPWPPGLPRRSSTTALTWWATKRAIAFLTSSSIGCSRKTLKLTTPTEPIS